MEEETGAAEELLIEGKIVEHRDSAHQISGVSHFGRRPANPIRELSPAAVLELKKELSLTA